MPPDGRTLDPARALRQEDATEGADELIEPEPVGRSSAPPPPLPGRADPSSRASSRPPPLPRQRPKPPAAPPPSPREPGQRESRVVARVEPKPDSAAQRATRNTIPDALLRDETLELLDPTLEPEAEVLPEAQANGLIARCEVLLAESSAPLRAARLHYEIARLCERPLGDVRRASNHYQQAYERAPDHLPTIRGLRRTLIARRALRQAVVLYDAEVRLTPDPRGKARLLFAKGRLLEDGLALRTDAQKAYAAALDICPSDTVVLKAQEQCEALLDSWSELAQTLGQQANALQGDTKQRAALLIQRAQVLEARLRDPEGACAQYETALELDPEAYDAIEALKRLYYARGRHRDLVRILELEASRSDDPRVRVAALHTVSRIQADKLGNRPDAVAALERALQIAPLDRLLLEELAQLREATRDYRGLASVLAQLVSALGDAPDRAGLLHRVGQIYEEHLDAPDSAHEWFARSLEADPCYVPALQALGNFYAANGRWDELLAMHLAEAKATHDVGRRAAAHARIAEILEKKLGDVEGAREHHTRALTALPGYAPSFKALTRLLAQGKRHRELIDLYERAIESAEPERALAYLLKVGALFEDQLDDPTQAMHAYRRVLARDPKHLGAIHALQRTAEAAERYGDLVQALLLEADLTSDKGQRVALLHRAAEVLDEHLNDREAAVTMLKRVVTLDPRYVPALTTLGRLYYHAGRWDDLLALYHAELAVLGDTPRAAQLLFKMAEIAEQRLGRHQEATDLYRRAVVLDGSASTALRALARKLQEQGRWEDLIEVLAKDVKNYSAGAERASLYIRIGEVCEFRLSRAEAALEAYDKALAEDETSLPALEARIRLRALRNETNKLSEDLARAVELATDPQRRMAMLMQLGEVLRDQQRDLRRAIACFESVRSLAPNHHGALLALESLYRKTNQWTELAGIMQAQAECFSDAESRAAALRELARLAQRGESVPVSPQEAYEQILTLSPDDLEALSALELWAIEHREDARLARVDERMAVTARDRSLRAAHLTRLGELLEARQPERALTLYRAAIETDPENLAAARGLSRLAVHSEQPDVLAEAAKREAEVLQDRRAAAQLYLRAAQRHVDADGKLSALEQALELDPENELVAARLREVLVQSGQLERLSELLAQAAATCREPARAASIWREVATLYRGAQGNVTGAVHALQRALRLVPDDAHTTLELADVYRHDAQWNEAAQLLTRVIERSSAPELLLRAHTELAGLHEQRFGDPQGAIGHLREAVKLAPEESLLLQRLSELLSREGSHAEAVTVAARLVEVSRSPDMRVRALLHLARVEQRKGGSPEEVARALSEAVALDGPLGGAGAAMREAVGTWIEWRDYEQAIRKHLEAHPTGRVVPVDLYLEFARVQSEHLDERETALATLGEAITQQPENLPLHGRRAALLRESGALAECADELRLLLSLDTERAQTWRDLAEVFSAMQRHEARARVEEVLWLLGLSEASADATPTCELPKRPGAWAGSVVDELTADLVPWGVTGELLASLSEALDKLYPPDLTGYGLNARDKLTARSGGPLLGLAERIGELVGAGPFELYVHRTRSRGACIELASVPLLVVPAWVAEQSQAHQVFVLARLLTLCARHSHPLIKLTPRELEVVFAAYARTVSPGFGRGLTSEELLDEQSRRLHKALSRKARKAAEDAVQRYVTQGTVDLVSWVESRQREASRVATLICGNLSVSLECLSRLRGEARDAPLDTGDGATRDLLRFWVGEPALNAREKAAR